jgi:hypothetical protein
VLGLHSGALVERGGSPEWIRAVPSSNQSGGRGVLTKRYSGQWQLPEDGVQWQGLSSCSQQWQEGAPMVCFNWVFTKCVQHSVGKLIGQSLWPKHRQDAALCVGAAARV